MNFEQLCAARHSVRKYQAGVSISDEDLPKTTHGYIIVTIKVEREDGALYGSERHVSVEPED